MEKNLRLALVIESGVVPSFALGNAVIKTKDDRKLEYVKNVELNSHDENLICVRPKVLGLSVPENVQTPLMVARGGGKTNLKNIERKYLILKRDSILSPKTENR